MPRGGHSRAGVALQQCAKPSLRLWLRVSWLSCHCTRNPAVVWASGPASSDGPDSHLTPAPARALRLPVVSTPPFKSTLYLPRPALHDQLTRRTWEENPLQVHSGKARGDAVLCRPPPHTPPSSLGKFQDDFAHVPVSLHVLMGCLDFSHWVDSVQHRQQTLGSLLGEMGQNLLCERFHQHFLVLR